MSDMVDDCMDLGKNSLLPPLPGLLPEIICFRSHIDLGQFNTPYLH